MSELGGLPEAWLEEPKPKRKIWFLPPDQWSPRAELLWWGAPLVLLLWPLCFIRGDTFLEVIGWSFYYTAWYIGWGWAFYGIRKRMINRDKKWLRDFMDELEQERRDNNGS